MDKAGKASHGFERLKKCKHINQYIAFLSQLGVQAEILWTGMSNVVKGLLQLIDQHRIKCLVMGASDEKLQTKLQETVETNFSKAIAMCQKSPPSCQIFFIDKGCLIYTRTSESPLNTTETLLPSTNVDTSRTTLANEPSENMEAENDRILKAESSDYLSWSSSRISWGWGLDEAESPEVGNKLNSSPIDVGNLERTTREDSLEAKFKAEAAESLNSENTIEIKDMEELVTRKKQEIETMRNKREELSKNLVLIQEKKPSLESQLREAQFTEKELEEKIIQAVDLLVAFKGARDELQVEYDSIIRKINKFRIAETKTASPPSQPPLFGVSFADIIEATDDFNPCHKIGEGRYGSALRGTLSHVEVVIKMLPSCGSQSDSEFKEEAEALCRLRHPNLVTLVGTCVDSRSLIYEYIDGTTLEDYLSSSPSKILPWQTRIRIVIEITRLLLFSHANYTSEVHGNLTPSNILLDSNLVAKVSDFGIHYFVPHNQNPTFCSNYSPENLAYMDPESLETGKLTAKSDVYSFGLLVLRLLTSRPAATAVRDVRCALEADILESVLDVSAGDWPIDFVKKLAFLALRCCERDPFDRPDLASEIWPVLEHVEARCSDSLKLLRVNPGNNQPKPPSHFVCPIYQEVMSDPHVAEDGFTYEGDAIRGWFNSGHKTSPMTNLKLESCDLVPNYALFYAIQEWQQNYT